MNSRFFAYVFIPVFTLLQSCSNAGKSAENSKDTTSALPTVTGAANLDKDSTAEGKALDLVSDLVEVEDVRMMVDKMTNGENHVKLVVMGMPEPKDPYYLIKVMEDNGESLVTHFSFKVSPDSSKIYFYDVIEDRAVPLESWRAHEKQNNPTRRTE